MGGGGVLLTQALKSLQLSHLLCLKNISLPTHYVCVDIWGAVSAWRWPEVEFLFIVFQKDQVNVWDTWSELPLSLGPLSHTHFSWWKQFSSPLCREVADEATVSSFCFMACLFTLPTSASYVFELQRGCILLSGQAQLSPLQAGRCLPLLAFCFYLWALAAFLCFLLRRIPQEML